MRVVRRIVHVLILFLVLLLGAAASAVVVSQTVWFKTWLRGYIVSEASRYLNGALSIGRLGGNLFSGVELEHVAVTLDGSDVVVVESLGLDYNAFQVLTTGLSVDTITLRSPTIYLRRDGDTWSLARLVKAQAREADREGTRLPITVDDIGISDAALVIDRGGGPSDVSVPERIEGLDAKLAFRYEPVRYSLEISHVSFRTSKPDLALTALSGGVSVRDDTLFVEQLAVRTDGTSLLVDGAVQHYLSTPQVNLQLSSDRLSLPELARLVPALDGINLQPDFELRLNGPLTALGIDLNVRSSAGQATGQLVADVQSPGQSMRGNLHLRHLNLAPLLNDPSRQTDLTGEVTADLTATSFAEIDSLEGQVTIRSPRITASGYTAEHVAATARLRGRRLLLDARASAYGASITATGPLTIPVKGAPLGFQLRGRTSRLDLAKLPRTLGAPPAATNITVDYRIAGSIPTATAARRITADAAFHTSTLPGATVAQGSTAGITLRGADLSYRADAVVNNLDLEQVGRSFDVAALAESRYQSLINLRVTFDGSGTTPEEMCLTARGAIENSTLLGGQVPRLAFDATVANDGAHVIANGTFADLDPAVASGRQAMSGRVAGSLAADARVASLSSGVTLDSVEGSVTIALEPSLIGGLAVDSAALNATYRARTGDISRFDVIGRDVNLSAQGTLALGSTGASNLTFRADSPRLQEIGKLFDVPVEGIARIDGTVTGNGDELRARGTLSADGLAYQGNGALSTDADYTVTVPDLTLARAAVEADTKATFLSVAGQNINTLTATTKYADRTITFDAVASQPQRSLDAGGTLELHPDHQECT